MLFVVFGECVRWFLLEDPTVRKRGAVQDAREAGSQKEGDALPENRLKRLSFSFWTLFITYIYIYVYYVYIMYIYILSLETKAFLRHELKVTLRVHLRCLLPPQGTPVRPRAAKESPRPSCGCATCSNAFDSIDLRLA